MVAGDEVPGIENSWGLAQSLVLVWSRDLARGRLFAWVSLGCFMARCLGTDRLLTAELPCNHSSKQEGFGISFLQLILGSHIKQTHFSWKECHSTLLRRDCQDGGHCCDHLRKAQCAMGGHFFALITYCLCFSLVLHKNQTH